MSSKSTPHHPSSRVRRFLLCVGYIIGLAGMIWLADLPRYKSVYIALIRHIPGGANGAYFLLIGGLGFVFNYALRCRTMKLFGQPFLLGNVLAFVIAVLEEASQIYIPSRVFDISDLGYDILGVFVIGWLTNQLFQRGIIAIPPA